MKILVYFSGEKGHAFFGALHYLQKKIPLEIYAIIDRNDTSKDFFEKQNFVNFKKIFFYRDSVKQFHKPDIDFLMKFEKKYDLKLWEIIFADPNFLTFDDTFKFSENEILSLIEDDCKFFDNIIENVKPDFLLVHVGGQKQLNLLTNIGISANVKILRFAPAKFGKRWQISKYYDLLDEQINYDSPQSREPFNDEMIAQFRNDLDLYDFFRSKKPGGYNFSKKKFVLGSLMNLIYRKNNSTNDYSSFKNSKIHFFSLLIQNFKKIQRQNFLEKNSYKKIDFTEKFVYFPLHVTPEFTTSIVAPYFVNQISLIENIARSLPIDYSLYVKEHPSMGKVKYWRSMSFYKKILDMPNVKLIHPNLDSKQFLEKASIIFTISGSSSYEALFYKKNVIVFSETSNVDLPSVTHIKNLEDLPQKIHNILNSPFNDYGCKLYFESKLKETIELDYVLFSEILENFFEQNTSIDAITNQKMEHLFNSCKEELTIFSNSILKKIQSV